ncbi:M23 family metallopeptidase [Amycolatopsis thermoflava]|uniref:M23 family metallopeptidase n=1 Tax=Amycolatopsis thermoflava TaxID=84480 RepID=UPI003814A5AE
MAAAQAAPNGGSAPAEAETLTPTGVGGGGAGVAERLVFPAPQRSALDEVAALDDAEQTRRDKAAQAARDEAARQEVARQEAARLEAARQEELRNRVFAPVTGVITSNYGPRWGTTHYGLDIANKIGTPIRSPMAGVVIEAGPASGFGLWVKIRHDDGTITVYGHINSYSVREGQRVQGGQVIAQVGNRGISTGPHLHFEVWSPSGKKVDPLEWLQDRGADVTAG